MSRYVSSPALFFRRARIHLAAPCSIVTISYRFLGVPFLCYACLSHRACTIGVTVGGARLFHSWLHRHSEVLLLADWAW